MFSSSRCEVLFGAALLVSTAQAIIAPNTSLATVPCAYFGGNAQQRGAENIAMLAKMRLVMVEKWEGHCWQDCLSDGPGSAPCQSNCGVENDILRTFGAVKSMNPNVATVLYWNTLLAFPFYTAVGEFKEHGLLTIDSKTKKPITIRNDNGMQGIFVYGFIAYSGWLSVSDSKMLPSNGFVGWDNYERLFTRRHWNTALTNLGVQEPDASCGPKEPEEA